MEMYLPLFDDFHSHLRQGQTLRSVALLVAAGGSRLVLVMPNTTPVIDSYERAVEYQKQIVGALEKNGAWSAGMTSFSSGANSFSSGANSFVPSVVQCMYMSKSLNPEDLRKAHLHASVLGVKYYPHGVTTGSTHSGPTKSGLPQDYKTVLSELERLGMTLHIHAEKPGASVITAEEEFLPEVSHVLDAFPKLKVVLEHVSTEAAVNFVKTKSASGKHIAATITAHHIDLTVDDVLGDAFNFCKPVAKFAKDRDAIREVIRSGNERFFLGSDSAPHSLEAKLGTLKNAPYPGCSAAEALRIRPESVFTDPNLERVSTDPLPIGCSCQHGSMGKSAAGIFTQAYLASYLADSFGKLDCLEKLETFGCVNGRKFFGNSLPESAQIPSGFESKTPNSLRLRVSETPFTIPERIVFSDGMSIIPYRAGQTLRYSASIVPMDFAGKECLT